MKEFIRPWGEVFGELKMNFSVPTSKVKCGETFGEHYLFLSCMNLCLEPEATCPLEAENRKLEYNSCPGHYPNRAYTLGNNSFLTFVDELDSGLYLQNFFRCDNDICIKYEQVCDLVDHCGDMSDEINCANHVICENTLNSSEHQFISLSQKCDGIYDCFDLSDECNDSCGREILGNWAIKIVCSFMGVLAVIFNLYTMINGIISLKNCQTESMMISRVLMSLIGSGDFLIGLYLIILSVYDSTLGDSYCRKQDVWLTGTECLILGVISTIGSQVSLFSMTVMSFIRMFGLVFRSMRIPGPVSKKAVRRVISMALAIITASLAVAFTPLLPFLEDYFVQGMYYDPAYKVFIGFPNRDRHIKVLTEYYRNTTGNVNMSDLSWSEIGEKMDGMFSQDHGRLTRRPVHFYGNDGVCLFKYFVRTDDARKNRESSGSETGMISTQKDPVVWTMLIVNLICFMIITGCYIKIIRHTKKSTHKSGQYDNCDRLRENRNMHYRIMVIIATDFLCWVPFIFISALHNLGKIGATSWYIHYRT